MIKRKLSGVTGQTQAPTTRKKQAVTATRSAVTKAIIQRNASESPLLKLPGEIREKIFSFVVGQQLIHISYYSAHGGICHNICKAIASEEEAYEEFMTSRTRTPSNDSAERHSVTFKDRHINCKPWFLQHARIFEVEKRCLSTIMTTQERRYPILDLSILRACRQIYEEANVLLWTTNTFSFEDSMPWSFFVNGLHSTQRTKLTRMHIDFAWNISSANEWEALLRPSLISKFKGLRTLHATFDQYFRDSSAWTPSVFWQNILTPLTRMQMLPLQQVTVIIDEDIRGLLCQPSRWPMTQKREEAESLRKKLLDPNGHEVLAVEMKAKEAERKQEKEEKQAAKAARQALRTGARG